jgi:hypothetical protein
MIRRGFACFLMAMLLAPAALAQGVYVAPDEDRSDAEVAARPNRVRLPGAVAPADRGALVQALMGALDAAPPDRTVERGMPSGSRLQVVASAAFVRRTGELCVGCRVPCRTFRYRYVRPDRGSVVVEGLRCRRPNGRWSSPQVDIVVAERPAQPGLAMPMPPGSPGGQRQPPIASAEPAPVPVPRPGGPAGPSADVAGAEVEPDDRLAAAEIAPIEQGGELEAGDQAEDVPPSADRADAAGQGPMPLGPDIAVAPAPAEPSAAPAPADEGGPAPATTGSAAAPSTAPAKPPAQVSADGPAKPPTEAAAAGTAASPTPQEHQAAAEPAGQQVARATTQEPGTGPARVIMPFGGNAAPVKDKPAGPIAVETTADPELVRMLRQLSYLDAEGGAEPTPAAVQAAAGEFASDEKLPQPVPPRDLKQRLAEAVERTASLSSCGEAAPAEFGVCLKTR